MATERGPGGGGALTQSAGRSTGSGVKFTSKPVCRAGFSAFFVLLLRRCQQSSMVAGTNGWQRCRAAFCIYKTIRRGRSTAATAAMSRLKQRLEQEQLNAAVTAMVLVGTGACEKAERRTEQRCLGKWRGSALSGYLRNDSKSRRAVALLARVFDSNILYSRARAFHGSQ